MPSILLQGVLLDPIGNPAPNLEMRFIALTTQGQTVESSLASYYTDSYGAYSFSLEYGIYTLEINLDREYSLTGKVYVDEAVPTPLSIAALVGYAPVVNPPIVVPDLPDWELLHRMLRTSVDTDIRDKIDLLGDISNSTQEIKKVYENPRLAAEMSEESVVTVAGTVKAETQTNVYMDEVNHQSIQRAATSTTSNGSIVELDAIYDASNSKVVIEHTRHANTLNSVHSEEVVLTDTSFKEEKELVLDTSGFKETKEASQGAIVGSKTVTLNTPLGSLQGVRTEHVQTSYQGESSAIVNQPKITLGNTVSLNRGIHSANIYDSQTAYVDVNDEVQTVQERGIVAYLKKAYQRIVNNGFISKMFTRVDNYIVEDGAGVSVFDVDTVNKVLRVKGRLEVENAEDFKGDSGDTIFEVFRYSPTPADAPFGATWHEEFLVGDNWRVFNKSINGYVDPSKWSTPIQLNGADGLPGDTLYFEYTYSADKVNWHPLMDDEDVWRRERVIENGVPTSPWTEPVRIRGLDGADADLTQYEYSYAISGLAAPNEWHYNFSTGDHFRRERIIYFRTRGDRDAYIPGSNITYYQATPWNNISQIVPINGVDYGAKQVTLYLYRRASSVPSGPSGTLTWNFTDLTLLPSSALNGWSLSVPPGEDDVYVALAVATTLGEEDSIGASEWNIEKWGAIGAPGTDGRTPAVITLFCISDSQPSVSFSYATQTLSTNSVTISGSNPQRWTARPPSNTEAGGKLWYITNAQLVEAKATTAQHMAYDFSIPALLSQNGIDGKPGTPGNHGQGSFRKYVTRVPDNTQKDADVLAISGRDVQDGDLFNYFKNDGSSASQFSRFFFRENGTWTETAFVVNGNAVIDGTLAATKLQAQTITGDKISSYSTIIAGDGNNQAGMNGYDAGNYTNWRFWAGNVVPFSAPFKVNGQGAVFASNITISGGSLNINNKFMVDILGNMTATSGTFTGVVNATSGYFKGRIETTDGYFGGTIYANKIEGDVVGGKLTPIPPVSLSSQPGEGGVWKSIFTKTCSASSVGISRSFYLTGYYVAISGFSTNPVNNALCRILVNGVVVKTISIFCPSYTSNDPGDGQTITYGFNGTLQISGGGNIGTGTGTLEVQVMYLTGETTIASPAQNVMLMAVPYSSEIN